MKISGYAAVFGNVDTENDRIARGAFQKTVKGPLLYNHDRDRILGRFTAKPDSVGLWMEAEIFDFLSGNADVRALIKKRVLRGLSIGYFATQVKYAGRPATRTLKKIDVGEISVVLFPANEKARIARVTV